MKIVKETKMLVLLSPEDLVALAVESLKAKKIDPEKGAPVARPVWSPPTGAKGRTFLGVEVTFPSKAEKLP